MRHLKRYNESASEDTKQEILDNFAHIIDDLGEPKIFIEEWGSKTKWTIKWKLDTDISLINDVSITANKLSFIVSEMQDILSAKDRMPDFNFEISIKDSIIVKITPKDTGENKFKFIIGQRLREIKIKTSEIERFFANKGLRVVNVYYTDSEFDSTSSVSFQINKFDNNIFNEFIRLFEEEYNKSDIDRNISARYLSDTIYIEPLDEKTYIIAD